MIQHTGTVLIGGGRPAVKLDLTRYSADDWDSVFGPGAHEATQDQRGPRGRRLSPADGWQRQGWFRKCADVRAKAVQTLPWAVYPAGTESGDYDAALYRDTSPGAPPEVAVLDGMGSCLYLIEASLSLTGRAYHLKLMEGPGRRVEGSRLGRFRGLQYVNPLLMEPELSASGIERYQRIVNGTTKAVDARAVLAVFQPDPFVEVGVGASDGSAAAMSAAVLDSMAAFLSRYLDGGLIRQTLLSIDGPTTEEQRKEMGDWWRRFMRRADPGDARVLSANVKPHVIGEGMKDLTSAEVTSEQREAISAAFGIPFSVMMSKAANYATAEVEERGFYQRTVIPQARLIERALNKHLLSEYGLAFHFEPERMEILQRYELEKAEKVAKVTGRPVMTVNEARHTLGLPPVDGGDELHTPAAPVAFAAAPEGRPAPRPDPEAEDEGLDATRMHKTADAFDLLLSLIPSA